MHDATDTPELWRTLAFAMVVALALATAELCLGARDDEAGTEIPGGDPCGSPKTECQLKVEIDEIVQPLIDSGERIGIVVGIVYGGTTASFEYGGIAGDGSIIPYRTMLFGIGSVSKTLTTLLLADMVEGNTLGLQDPVEDYLPSSVSVPSLGGRKITLLDLATHTSGLPSMPDNFQPRDDLNPYADYTAAMLYDFLSGFSLQRRPGTRYEYSNLGMALLGHVLELRAGTKYEELIEERICKPLGMTDTRITLTEEDEQRLAQGNFGEVDPNALTPRYVHEEVPNWDFDVFAPAGGFCSTVQDMLKYLSANLGMVETDLSSAIALTHTIRRQMPSQDMEICLGWHAMNHEGVDVIMHHGATYGFHCNVLFVREEGVGVVLLSNTYVQESDSIDEAGLRILEALREQTCMDNYGRLLGEHASLKENLTVALSDLRTLNESHASLGYMCISLESNLSHLQTAYAELNSSLGQLSSDKDLQLRRARARIYLLLGATLALVAMAGYLLPRARRVR